VKMNVQCLECSSVFELPDSGMRKCIKCGAEFLVEYSSTKDLEKLKAPHQEATSNEGSNTTVISTVLDEDMDDDDAYQLAVKNDIAFQLHLSLKLFVGGSTERVLYLLRTPHLKNGHPDERVVHLVLTNLNVYLLRKDHMTEAISVLAVHSLKEIRRITLGLFFQLFHIEMSENFRYTMVVRSHERVHKLVDTLMAAAQEIADPLVPPVERSHKSKETHINIRSQIMQGRGSHDLQLYVMLHHRSTIPKGTALVPRSLIVTQDHLSLCTDDYTQWPSSGFPNSKLPTTPQFRVILTRCITDMVGLQVSDSRTLIISFEDEDGAAGANQSLQAWELVVAHTGEQKRIIKTLSALWQAAFKTPLMVEYATNSNTK